MVSAWSCRRRQGWLAVTVVLLANLLAARAYIPAQPSNDTEEESPTLTVRWSGGMFMGDVSYQMAQEGSNGLTYGALVHFTQKNATNVTTITPWIAFIPCDDNSTSPDLDEDVFTAAQERGATGALLYSMTSATCIINEGFFQPPFEQIMDIYAITTRGLTNLVQSTFTEVNETLFYNFDATTLNNSYAVVLQAMNGGTPAVGSYLIAALVANNFTANVTEPTPPPDNSQTTSTSKGPSTSLAMIILYAITGCVSLLFCVVILSGAIRAIRNPERYGPRSADPLDPSGQGQTRTAGITRAILDTFPVIKFGMPSHTEDTVNGSKQHDLEFGDGDAVQMTEIHRHSERDSPDEEALEYEPGSSARPSGEAEDPEEGGSRPRTAVAAPPAIAEQAPDTDPQLGRDSCPICILDFEDGDDLRVLPCEGRHRFHKDCVDQWLLESSGSCPLCREDFHILESQEEPQEDPTSTDEQEEQPHMSPRQRLSQFLRFKRRSRATSSRRETMVESPSEDPVEEEPPAVDEAEEEPPTHPHS